MANLNYWDGTQWVAIGTGGPQGPAGVPGQDGESVTVFVQPAQPTPKRSGDVWINEAAARSAPPRAYKTLDDIGFKTLDDLKTYPTLDDI